MSYKKISTKGKPEKQSRRKGLQDFAGTLVLLSLILGTQHARISLCPGQDPSTGKASRIDAQLSYQASMRKEKTDRATELEQRQRESTDAARLFAFPDAKSKERATRPSSSRR